MKISTFRLIFLFVGLVYIGSLVFFQRWEIVLAGGDPWGYYVYLPATFIHHDLDSLDRTTQARYDHYGGQMNESVENPLGIGEAHLVGEGRYVSKYTMGIAILTAPFFWLGHIWAFFDPHYQADGFSFPYALLMQLSTMFYAFLGLFYLGKILLHYVSEQVACWVILAVGMGTNLFFMTIYVSYMAHAYQFALFALLIWHTILWHERPTWSRALIIGLLCGFITLIRPVEFVCIFIPLLYGLRNREDWRARIRLMNDQRWKYLTAILAFVLVGFLQMLYWKWQTGQWLFYSYTGEGFDFSKPRIWRGLFGFRNGWLIYTPIMVLAVSGMVFLRRHRDFLWPIVVILPLHLYITYSWWCWYYINGFGARPMIDLYALLAIPMAYFVDFLLRKGKRMILLPIGLLLIALNLFQSFQISRGVLLTDDMTWSYYRQTFLKTKMDYYSLMTFDSGLMSPDTSRLTSHSTLFEETFENPDRASTIFDEERQSFVHLMAEPWGRASKLAGPLKDFQLQKKNWIRLEAWFKKGKPRNNLYDSAVFETYLKKDEKVYNYKLLRIENKIDNPTYALYGGNHGVWDHVEHWFQIPSNAAPADSLFIEIRNSSDNELFVDDLVVTAWTR